VSAHAPYRDFSNGPAQAGEHAVWVEGGGSEYRSDLDVNRRPVTIHRLAPSGEERTIFTLDAPPEGGHTVRIVASERRIALLRTVSRPFDYPTGPPAYTPPGTQAGWESVREELWLGTPDGGFELVQSGDSHTGQNCSTPGLAALSGDLLALDHYGGCAGDERVTVRNLAKPEEPPVLPARGQEGYATGPVAMAGRYVAWLQVSAEPPEDPRQFLVVYDLDARSVAYRLEPMPSDGDPFGPSAFSFDVQDDGTVAIARSNASYTDPPKLAWASVAEPWLHELPATTWWNLDLSIAGGLVVVRRLDLKRYAVVDLNGQEVNAFDHVGSGYGDNDFDGRRVVWYGAERIHNEPFPVVPATDAPDGTVPVAPDGSVQVPVWCPDPVRACAGLVSVLPRTAKGAAARAGRKRFRIPARRVRQVRLRVSRATVRRLRQRSRVRARARVATRRGGAGQPLVLVRRWR
jgi:hypothetical protein